MNHRERMLAGLPYLANQDGLNESRMSAQELLYTYNNLPPQRWEEQRGLLEQLLGGIWSAGEHSFTRFERLLYSPWVAFPLFAAIFLLTFLLAFGKYMPGALLKSGVQALFDGLGGALGGLAAREGSVAAADFLGALFGGAGMLFSFVPQVALLYLSLYLLEESGFMSVLAFLTDGLFGRIGLTGRAVFSLLLGFGCLSCSAKLPVYVLLVSAFFGGSFLAVAGIYLAGVLLALTVAFLHRKDGGEEFILEAARLQRPSLRLVLGSLLFSLRQFIIKIVTTVSAVLVVLWFLLSFSFRLQYVGVQSGQGMLAVLCRGARYLFYPMGITDWRYAYALVTGFAAKENIAATISMLSGSANLPAAAALACCVFVLACPACISAFASSVREVGFAKSLKFAAVQLAFAFAAAYITHFLFSFA